MYYYKGEKCTYKLTFQFTAKQMAEFNVVEITEEEYVQELDRVKSETQGAQEE